ncbi:solute carrier family 23 protein [Acinetobacter sp.]|uniref:uracil-xanthine permease family protein n=1 Tax=Acinetobacter sp. TaxID=472 RepID=UPI00258A919D|nr:solute carrier family 23 protein [Acinetobacter sp.]
MLLTQENLKTQVTYRWLKLFLLGLQHVLAMVAVPITSVFLVSKALALSPELTINLISATFLVCGLGTLIQSFGPCQIGARLPFIMIPGGAPIVMFVGVAQAYDLQTASGAVILTSLFYFLILPIFKRLLRFFPDLVIGILLLLVSINLIKIYGAMIIGSPDSPHYASPINIGLCFFTIAMTILFARILNGILSRFSVLLGLVSGVILAAIFDQLALHQSFKGTIFNLPSFLPFGTPHFDLIATIPFFIFCIISMIEATGQTLAVAEITGSKRPAEQLVPSTIRGDASMSLLGGLLGTSLIITSGENIGILRATQIKTRHVTIIAGFILLFFSIFTPLAHVANLIPVPVVAGTAIIVFAIIGTIGINMLRKVDLQDKNNMYVLAGALTFGLTPILIPNFYTNFPDVIKPILNNGLAMGTIAAIILNIIFNLSNKKNTPVSKTEF